MWTEKRTCNCLFPKQRRKAEKIDITSFQKEETYADFFQEGTVTPMDQFLVDRGFVLAELGSEKMQQRFVEQALCSMDFHGNKIMVQQT